MSASQRWDAYLAARAAINRYADLLTDRLSDPFAIAMVRRKRDGALSKLNAMQGVASPAGPWASPNDPQRRDAIRPPALDTPEDAAPLAPWLDRVVPASTASPSDLARREGLRELARRLRAVADELDKDAL